MNDIVNFSRKKKNKKNTRICGKKNTTHFVKKYVRLRQILNEWRVNFSWKKKTSLYYFLRIPGNFLLFEENRLTGKSLPSFPGILGNFQEFEGNRLTRKLLPSFPGIPGNFQEFQGNQLTEKLLPSFPGIPGIIHEDEYY